MSRPAKMGVVVATAISITIVVGAGLLALPGLSYAHAGHLGYVPWVIVAVVMLPLLKIFADFATQHPSAGGVVGYVRLSLGHRMACITEIIVLGTFSLGIPAIALIGADYLHAFWPDISVTYAGIALVTIGYGAGVAGLRISGGVQTALAALIVLGLVAIGLGFVLHHAGTAPELDVGITRALLASSHASADHPLSLATDTWHATLQGLIASIPVILFAFTGWELTAFLAEDMRRPERTLPISIWASFCIVVTVYLFIAWVVATYADQRPGWQTTPFVLLAHAWLGDQAGRAVALIGVLVVLANVVAAFLSASRGIFAAGRDGLLPRAVGRTNFQGEPLIAMTLTWVVFVSVIIAAQSSSLGVGVLLQLAGQNFFVLYLLAALGYAHHYQHQPRRRWVGAISVMCVLAMMGTFNGLGIVYCTVLAALGYWLSDAAPQATNAPLR